MSKFLIGHPGLGIYYNSLPIFTGLRELTFEVGRTGPWGVSDNMAIVRRFGNELLDNVTKSTEMIGLEWKRPTLTVQYLETDSASSDEKCTPLTFKSGYFPCFRKRGCERSRILFKSWSGFSLVPRFTSLHAWLPSLRNPTPPSRRQRRKILPPTIN